MNITIYVDIFFFWNLIVDYVILSIIAVMRKQKASKGRRFLSSFVGSIFAVGVLVFFKDADAIYMILCYVVIAIFILLITFKASSKKLFIKNYLFFILTANCTAGIMMSLGILSDLSIKDIIKGYKTRDEGLFSENAIYVFFYIMSYVIPVIMFLWYKYRMPEDEDAIYDVVIRYQQKDWHGTGFLDTGNLLMNPVNGKPVILLEKKYFEELIGNGFVANEEGMLSLLGLCAVPFKSAGEKNGILYGVSTTEIVLAKSGEMWCSYGVVVVCCENLISTTKDYQLLLNPRMIV